ncbi:MAG: DNA internalization-related competence protein ComEC/Rec2 [Clostridiales bacterium]|nr:DNA internalization-related competence protein ComEC/Rec2 [Clostridiales bacterium]
MYKPDRTNRKQQNGLYYTLDDLHIDGKKRSYKLRLYVYGNDPEYAAGDVLSAEKLKLSIPSGVRNPNGFDFNKYLWADGTALVSNANSSDIIVDGKQTSVKSVLLGFREKLADICDEVFAEQSDVTKAVLLGDRSDVSESVYSDFSTTGISHVLALSGLHVSLIALLLEWVLSKIYCPRSAKHIVICLLLWAYTVMTGAGASTVRALLMYAIACITIELGYWPDTLSVMSWAFIIQTAFDPLLIDNKGFIMSYASVFAILSFIRPGRNGSRSKIGRAIKAIGDSAKASFAVQVLTFPLLASLFYGVPLLSVPINMICVPMAILALYMGFVIVLLGLISTGVAGVLAVPVKLIWEWIKAISAFTAKLPFAYAFASAWPVLVIAIYMLLAFGCSVYITNNLTRRVTGISAMLIIAVFCLLPGKQIDHLRITVLDEGSSDCIVLNAQGDVYLVDAGKDNSIAADFLISERMNLRGVFLSHTDIDHYGGIFDVLRRYPNVRIYLPECWDRQNPTERLLDALYGKDITYLSAGDTVQLSKDVLIDVLWPNEGFEPPSDNDGCLVMAVRYKGTDMLLAADIGEKYDSLINVPCEILKVSHHGSKYATTDAFLDSTEQKAAIISVGGNSFGHPTEETLSRLSDHGAEIYRTDYMGAITIDVYNDGEYTITPFLLEAK